jgi:DNA ligase (NAD+)
MGIAMLSQKVSSILKTKGFTEDQLSTMTESDAWDHVYRLSPPKKDKLPEICFTGFQDDELPELHGRTMAANLKVVTTVTVGLRYLCTGPSPGPSKLAKAAKQGVIVVTGEEFERLVSTGELPA